MSHIKRGRSFAHQVELGNFDRPVSLGCLRLQQASVPHLQVAKAGLSGLHVHDLRHTGNQFAADEGADLRELMDRMGHSTTRAAKLLR